MVYSKALDDNVFPYKTSEPTQFNKLDDMCNTGFLFPTYNKIILRTRSRRVFDAAAAEGNRFASL